MIQCYIDPDDGNAYILSPDWPDDGKSSFVSLTDIFGSHGRTVKRSDLQMWESRDVDPLSPDQIRVSVILPPELRKRAGHETFGVPLGGGRVEASVPLPGGGTGKISVEVYPESSFANLENGRTRSYDKLKALRDQIVKNGGYLISGDQMQIGDEIVSGRDQLELLRMIARHWGEQAGDQGAAYRQGYDAGKRAVAEAVKTTMNAVGDIE